MEEIPSLTKLVQMPHRESTPSPLCWSMVSTWMVHRQNTLVSESAWKLVGADALIQFSATSVKCD